MQNHPKLAHCQAVARHCVTCQDEYHGRTDKRYCSVKCKNEHHKVARKHNEPFVDSFLTRLNRNLTVIRGLLNEAHNSLEVDKRTLVSLGFDLELITHVVRRNGEMLAYIKDYLVEEVNDLVLRFTATVPDEKDDSAEGEQNAVIFFRRWEADYPKDLRKGWRDEEEEGGDFEAGNSNSPPDD